jgi:serine/threonine protein kinase
MKLLKLEHKIGAKGCRRDMILPADPDVQAESSDQPAIGSVVDERYRILEVAGTGGMGVVYKAEHVHISRVFALKMLLREAYADEQAFKRFKQEARAASQLNHPHIVGIHDFGILAGNQPYLAMDFLAGTGLNSVIQDQGALPLARFKHIFSQACDALHHAHQHGVVHRDIKPSNIVLTEKDGDRDFVVIVDFGLVKLMSDPNDQKLTSTNMLVGSPLYMSPEQCRGKNVDHRTDIYSLGCCMYEALTAHPPFMGDSPLDTLYKHVAEPARSMQKANPNVYIPPVLEQVVMKALSKEADQRQQNMAQLKEEIEQAIEGGAPSSQAINESGSTRISVIRPQQAVSVAGPGAASSPVSAAAAAPPNVTAVGGEPKHKKSIWYAVVGIACVAAAIIGSLATVVVIQKQTINKETAELQQEEQKAKTPAPATAAPLPVVPTAVAPPAPPQPTVIKPKGPPPESAAQKDKDLLRNREAMQSKEQQLQDQADSAYESQNWQEARKLYLQCLPLQETLFGKNSDLLVPVLAKTTVCSWKLNDGDATAETLNRFADLYRLHPKIIANNEMLLNQLFKLTYAQHDLSLSEQLMAATIEAHEAKTQKSDFASLVLRLELAKLYGEAESPHRQETELRQVFDATSAFPMLHFQSGTQLVRLLKQQQRDDEAQQIQMQIIQKNQNDGQQGRKNNRRFGDGIWQRRGQ